jgi:trimethylamine--corrinoid protein Co-methyltransferase
MGASSTDRLELPAALRSAAVRPSLRVLDDALIDRIIDEALDVLASTGMEIRGAELRRRLADAGLPRDAGGDGRIRFPRDAVERAIASAPSNVVLYDRDGAVHADLGEDRVHFVPGSSGLKIADHRTGEVRLARTADFVDYIRLADGLANIAYVATAFSTNDDIEVGVADAWRLRLVLSQTRRPVVSGAFTEHGLPRMAAMMELFRRDRADLIARPMSIFTITASGNFRYSEDSCQNLIDCVEAGIPVEIVPVTLMGLIAPVTLVGATVFHTVDVLAGITMAQLLRPGTPVLFGGAPATFHMKIASSPMAAIEALKLDTAYVQVAKRLGLPTQSYMALSDAKLLDAQAGAETFGSALLAALAGVNSVSGPGMLDFLLVFSLPKLVFDDEWCGQALRFARDAAIDGDVPVAALVEQVLADQHLLTASHTLRHWPDELWLPSDVVDRDNRETWLGRGGTDSLARATAEVDRRLAAYRAFETDPAIGRELDAIIRAGLREQTDLPAIPPPPSGEVGATERARGRRGSRRRPA